MKIATCQAANLAELMDKLRQTYGPDAVLLSVRRIKTGTDADAEPVLIEGTVGFEAEEPLAPEHGQPTARLPVAHTLRNILSSNGRGEQQPAAPCVALVGPMGSGKTTTAAKIAGRLARERRQPAGVISTETERPGGAALLLAYASALRLHATTAGSAPDLQDRLARWNCRGPLVIDTRSCGPRDGWAIERLGALLDAVPMCERRYLVLSAAEHPAIARECLDAFAGLRLSGVVLTRVDQAAGLGHCLEQVRRHNLEIVYLGTGERVPEDLVEPKAGSLSALESGRGAVLV